MTPARFALRRHDLFIDGFFAVLLAHATVATLAVGLGMADPPLLRALVAAVVGA